MSADRDSTGSHRGVYLVLAIAFFFSILILATNLNSARAGLTVQVTNCDDPTPEEEEDCRTVTRRNGVKSGDGKQSQEITTHSFDGKSSKTTGPGGDTLSLDLTPSLPEKPEKPKTPEPPKTLKE